MAPATENKSDRLPNHWRNDARPGLVGGARAYRPGLSRRQRSLAAGQSDALPLGVLGTVVGSLLAGRDVEHEKRFGEVMFQIQTGVRSSQS